MATNLLFQHQETYMPVIPIRGVDINYRVLGERGPWIALQPGGRRGLDGVVSLAEKIAEAGYRVLIYDRRNCGASDVSFAGGDAENEIWAEDLHEMLMRLDASPAFVGGSSSGCRLALLFALRHPTTVRGLLLWRVTGGAYAAQRLVEQYYGQFIAMARSGGMAAVCASEHFAQVITANPANRERLMGLDVDQFVAVMERWRLAFNEGAEHPVIGLAPEELRSLAMPACIIAGNDPVHLRRAAQTAHRLMPQSEYHELFAEDFPDLDGALLAWERKEGLLAATFIDFLRRAHRRTLIRVG
ncbi:MAG TPA: alpha/beta hydrolase [Stellaceae bacterium]|nr:alpha/beta hydrolase [Stellaceae bacterium]